MYNLGFYSGKGMPPVRFIPGVVDRVLEVIALLLLLSMWGFAIYTYTTLPNGNLEHYITLGAATIAMVLIAWVGYIPIHLINFPFRLTMSNVAVQYLYAVRFARVLNVVLGGISLCIMLNKWEGQLGVAFGTFDTLTYVCLTLFLIATTVYYAMAYLRR